MRTAVPVYLLSIMQGQCMIVHTLDVVVTRLRQDGLHCICTISSNVAR